MPGKCAAIMFEKIIDIRNNTFPHGSLTIKDGEPLEAFFMWENPMISKERYFHLVESNYLPKQYLDFLNTVSNGATLYYDKMYGQWGYKIYGLNECLSKQKLWMENLLQAPDSPYLVFCELYGDNSVLVFDKSSFQTKILETNYLHSSEWNLVANSLDEWLTELINHDGAKYWE